MEILSPPLQHVRIPFREIGEPGWVERSLVILDACEVPRPEPIPIEDIRAREATLGLQFSEPYVQFLSELGPVAFAEFPFYNLRHVQPISALPHASLPFSDEERARLPHLVQIVDYCGNGDPIALDTQTGECVLVSHDPVGLWLPFPSMSAFGRVAFLLVQDDGSDLELSRAFDAQIARWHDWWPFS